MKGRLATVGEYMSTPVRTVHGRTSLREVSGLLGVHQMSALPVVDDDGQIVGVISLTDLIRLGHIHGGDAPGRPVVELPDEPTALAMNPDPITVPRKMSVAKAARLLIRRRIHRLYVAEQGLIRGVFAVRDLVQVVADGGQMAPVSEYMNEHSVTVPATASIPEAITRLEGSRVHAVVVMRDGMPVGTFTQDEALSARQVDTHAEVQDTMNRSLLTLPQSTPIRRAAHQALLARPAMIVAMEGSQACGVMSMSDFAFAAM